MEDQKWKRIELPRSREFSLWFTGQELARDIAVIGMMGDQERIEIALWAVQEGGYVLEVHRVYEDQPPVELQAHQVDGFPEACELLCSLYAPDDPDAAEFRAAALGIMRQALDWVVQRNDTGARKWARA